RRVLADAAGAVLAAALVSNYGLGLGDWPAGWGFSLVTPATNALNWVTNELTGISSSLSSFLTLDILNPLQRYLSDLPWWVVAAVVGAVGWQKGGLRRCAVLVACVVLLGLMQAPAGYTFEGITSYDFPAWSDAMETLSLVLVALVLDLALGVP